MTVFIWVRIQKKICVWSWNVIQSPVVPIYVEHWGGIICNFTPILPYFQHWGDEARQLFFFHVNQEKTKKKVFTENWSVFVPENEWRPKQKKASPKIEKFLSPKSSKHHKKTPKIIQRSDIDHSQIIGGLQMQTIVKVLKGMQSNYLGGVFPPVFGTPDSNLIY